MTMDFKEERRKVLDLLQAMIDEVTLNFRWVSLTTTEDGRTHFHFVLEKEDPEDLEQIHEITIEYSTLQIRSEDEDFEYDIWIESGPMEELCPPGRPVFGRREDYGVSVRRRDGLESYHESRTLPNPVLVKGHSSSEADGKGVQPTLQDENEQVFHLNQSMIGAISPNFRTVSIEPRDNGCYRLFFVLWRDDPRDREAISQIISRYKTRQNSVPDFDYEVRFDAGPMSEILPPGRSVYSRKACG